MYRIHDYKYVLNNDIYYVEQIDYKNKTVKLERNRYNKIF